ARSGAIAARTRLPIRRPERAVEAKIRERVDALAPDEIDVRALAAVAAVGAAERTALLATNAPRAAPTVAGLHLDDCFVDETHGSAGSFANQKPRTSRGLCDPPARSGKAACGAITPSR